MQYRRIILILMALVNLTLPSSASEKEIPKNVIKEYEAFTNDFITRGCTTGLARGLGNRCEFPDGEIAKLPTLGYYLLKYKCGNSDCPVGVYRRQQGRFHEIVVDTDIDFVSAYAIALDDIRSSSNYDWTKTCADAVVLKDIRDALDSDKDILFLLFSRLTTCEIMSMLAAVVGDQVYFDKVLSRAATSAAKSRFQQYIQALSFDSAPKLTFKIKPLISRAKNDPSEIIWLIPSFVEIPGATALESDFPPIYLNGIREKRYPKHVARLKKGVAGNIYGGYSPRVLYVAGGSFKLPRKSSADRFLKDFSEGYSSLDVTCELQDSLIDVPLSTISVLGAESVLRSKRAFDCHVISYNITRPILESGNFQSRDLCKTCYKVGWKGYSLVRKGNSWEFDYGARYD